MHAKIVGLLGALLMFAACSSTPPETPPPGPPGGPPGGAGSRNIVPGSQQDLEASAGDRVFFAFDRADISPEARQILARQADWLRRYPNVTVTIEGHCDERGTREYNLALGERRAQAAKKRPRRIRDSGIPDLDHQLREGAPGGGRFLGGVVCPKPPRRHRHQLSMSRLRAVENSKDAGHAIASTTAVLLPDAPFFCPKRTLLGLSTKSERPL